MYLATSENSMYMSTQWVSADQTHDGLQKTLWQMREHQQALEAKLRESEARLNTEVTERRRAEADSIEARRNLELAIDASDAAIWTTDLVTREVSLSEGWSRMLGRESGATKTTIEALMSMTHPQD